MKQEDNKFKQALGQDVPQWDDAPIWDEIEKTLPPKKEKRRFIWFFTGLSLLAVIASIFFLLPETRKNKIVPTTTSETELTYIEKETTSENRNYNKRNKIDSQTIENNNPKPTAQTSNSIQSSSSTINGINNILTNTVSTTITQPIEKTTIQTGQLITTKNTAVYSGSDIQLPLIKSIKTLTVGRNPFKIKKRKITELNRSLFKNIKPLNSNSSSSDLEFFGGLYYTTRIINSSSQEADNFLERTTPVETFDLGIKYTQHINSQWAISTGITRRQTTEIFTSRDTLIEMDQVQTDTAILVGVVPVAGLLNRTTYTPRTLSNPNRLRQLLIPIQVCYKLPISKIDLNLSIGTDLRITSNYSGYLMEENGNLTRDKNLISGYYNSSFAINSINLSASTEFLLTNTLDLNLGVYMSYGLADHYSNNNIKLTYNLYGARIGIVKTFH